MKLKHRIIFLSFLALIIFVSFKILEPEILKKPPPAADSEKPAVNTSREYLIQELIKKYRINNKISLRDSPWKIAAGWVSAREVHPEFTPEIGTILREMSTREILAADVGYKGTQLKLSLILKGGQRVVFKPKWFERDYVVMGPPYAGADRHNGEIAAFHLGRILEFRRTPLAVGRRVHLGKEIVPVTSEQLLKTFFYKDNNTCFYGKCPYCKSKEDGVCGNGEIMEGTIVLWLPKELKLKLHKHPWSRTYRNNTFARWETEEHYCSKVKLIPQYSEGPLLMDIMDTAIFDFLIGNADRHHFETFDGLKESMLLIMDNAKSFGNPHYDEDTILAPVYQCCIVRFSTWQRLLVLQDGVLGSVLSGILAQDPIAPILTPEHLSAIDRRLLSILAHIDDCISKYGVWDVIVTDR